MKTVTFLLLLLSAFHGGYAQEEKIEQSWVRQDSIFIFRYSNDIKSNPLSVEARLQPDKRHLDKLGFGYSSIEGSTGKGYVSVFYQLIYYQGKLLSYRLNPQMPNDRRLTARYRRFYASLYQFDENEEPLAYYCNFSEMAQPLDGHPQDISSSQTVAYLMTPYSGITYGYRGGIGSSILENRAAFEKVKARLSPQEYILLLFSKNPATRLTAIEHYYRNPALFAMYQSAIEARIQVIYRRQPETQTIYGCSTEIESSKKLVTFYVNEGKQKSK